MAENSGNTAGDTPASKRAADGASGEKKSNAHLPAIESPPLSPGESAAASEPALDPSDLVVFAPAASSRASARSKLRHRRNTLFAAWGAAAVAAGVIAGMAIGAALVAPTDNVSAVRAERQATQRLVAGLNKDVAALKASFAASEKSAHSEIAKLTERLNSAPEITGSIPAAPAITVATPLPPARPAPSVNRPALVHDWFIRYVRGGFVYVQESHGDVFQVQLGAPLPGIGPVQDVKHQDGRWFVVTPKGLIVSRRDRDYFRQF
jgi:hypothetical protein